MKADPAAALGRVVEFLVSRTLRRPWWTLALCAAVTLATGWLAITRFTLDSDVTRLFPQDLSWRLAELRLEQAFPQRRDLIVVVLDAPTADVAADRAARLTAALSARPDLLRRVDRPEAGEFWERHGLLYLETGDLRDVTERLIAAQPLLGAVAADPSLRGLARLLTSLGEGLARGDATASQAAPVLDAIAGAAQAALAGRVAPPDWARLVTGRAPAPLELRRLILVQPALDFARLSSGSDATAFIRAEAARLGIPGLRLTGTVPMADEEFASVAEGAVENTVLSFGLVALLLWMALRSFRLIWPLLVLVVVGLAWTAGFGILAVGSFNPLSIAFAVLFIGLGVDFGLQYAVQFRAENAALRAAGAENAALRAAGAENAALRAAGAENAAAVSTAAALQAAARTAGPGMTLAALAVTGSFLAFLPTDYRGVGELGLIAGAGMMIGWFLAMTLLPALLLLARPTAEAREVGYPGLRGLDEWLGRRAARVCLGAAALALGCTLALGWLRFDANPINLRDPASEAVATWRDLARDPETNPNTLDVLAEGLPAAQAQARRLAALPEVARATTLADFVPPDQLTRLALIEDAAMLLGPALLASGLPPPDDAAAVAALAGAARALAGHPITVPLRALAEGPPAARAAFAEAVLPGLASTLARVRLLLAPSEVTLESLPESLRAGWITATGQARIEVAPAALPGDETAQMRRFALAVQAVAPGAVGLATSALGSSETIEASFVQSGLLALALVLVLLWGTLRSFRLAVLALAPLGLAGLMTLAHCALLGPDLNLANVIALPLLFGMGVAYDIYFVAAWQQGRRDLLASPLNRAVIYSAVTNAAAFGALAVSPHPGTASMGIVLSVSLVYSLACVMLVLPPLLRLFAPNGR